MLIFPIVLPHCKIISSSPVIDAHGDGDGDGYGDGDGGDGGGDG